MKDRRKISFITTVFNEEKTIDKFLESLFSQSKLPDEVIIVDGGSIDDTFWRIKNQGLKIKDHNIVFKVLSKKGNRSVGRNEAIKNATGDVIVCSDSGNILDKKWVENITKPFNNKNVDVVAGYYRSLAKNVFQKCLTPFVLVMPDKVDYDNFLPATRSVAFTKLIWKKVGGFPEEFSHNEDYVFANRLKEKGAKIIFSQDSIVYWLPRNTFKEAFIMFFRFALGDAESGILRTNVLLLFARYILGFYLIFLGFLYKSYIAPIFFTFFFIIYIFWAIKKNYKYVSNKEAIKFLPLLQLTADTSVLSGTIIGILKRIIHFNFAQSLKRNKFIFFILTAYIGILLFTLRWGIPNGQHPFPYHMDEWHQLQAIANTFRYGTPNIAGSANGTMFHFLLSGFYLIPFILLKIIDPFSLHIDNLFMRERVFEILRLQSILFGVLSIITLYKIAGLINASKKVAIVLFTFSPIWLTLSGYFKYDIALIFWLLLSIQFFILYAKDPNSAKFILAALPVGLAVATKVSAIPLVFIYFVSFFIFNPSWKDNYKTLSAGLGFLAVIMLFFGIPDTLFGKGNILQFLYENIILNPSSTSNFRLGMNSMQYLFTRHFFVIYGHGLMFLFILSFPALVYIFTKHNSKSSKILLFLFLSLVIFTLSIMNLQIGALGNRSLVLLPFLVLFISLTYRQIPGNLRIIGIVLISVISIIQIVESFGWIYIKIKPSPQMLSSVWIENNISKKQPIGIENIPIYQYLPDIIQKEFYFGTYNIKQTNNYKYQVINNKTASLPMVVVITNDQIENKLLIKSPKKDLLKRLEKEKYKKIASFSPDFTYNQFFVSVTDYYLSGIVAAPVTTSIYIKNLYNFHSW